LPFNPVILSALFINGVKYMTNTLSSKQLTPQFASLVVGASAGGGDGVEPPMIARTSPAVPEKIKSGN